MKRIYLLLTAILLTAYVSVTAQTIKGRVVSADGNSMAWATVHFKNSSQATVTDTAGYFKIIAKTLPDTLIIAAVGFNESRVLITSTAPGDSTFTIVLTASHDNLKDVVVTPYGVERKRYITGSVATVSADMLKYSPGMSIDKKGAVFAKPSAHADIADKTLPGDIVPQSNSQYAVQQLTAGEVNDFNKWTMWEGFTQGEFKQLSEHWKLFTNERYCALLQNKEHAAIVGRQVYLINRPTGDTVWQAMTDNTGKAELWAGVTSEQKTNADYSIACAGCETYNKPTQFANGVNKLTVEAPCYASNNVDIAFVVDATGSMGDEIEFLKTELENILDKSSGDFKGINLNAGAVFYRDKGDVYLTKYSGFDSNLATTYNFIKQQSADGGGDTPEAVDDALHTALEKLQWSNEARTKLLFLVLDAPPHDEARDEMFILMKEAAAKGIRIIPVVCSGADKTTEFMMRNLALTTNGTYVFLTDDSGIGDSHIKPTTDTYKVELLTNLLQRLIKQMIFTNTCGNDTNITQPVIKIPGNTLQVKVMPNPTRGAINIQSNKNVKEMYVTDYTGKILIRVKDNSRNIMLNIGDYPNGMYLIKYITTDNEWGAEKVLLMH